MKKVKKLLKFSLIFVLFVASGLVITGSLFYYNVTKSVSLDETKLSSPVNPEVKVFDRSGKEITPPGGKFSDISEIKPQTINAFICAEDKRFFIHKGIDYIRICGAIVSNIKSGSFAQGGSTISQQLIKNTQLTNEKTIKRKLREMKMTRQLEDRFSKSEILGFYLNNIYFGNGCYGIVSAANHYFNKTPENLDLAESALLAATINAPGIYNIEKNFEKANRRKELILKLMLDNKKIGEEQYNKAMSEKIQLRLTPLPNNNYLYNEIIKEASEKVGAKDTKKLKGLKIYTYISLDLQQKIDSLIKNGYSGICEGESAAAMVVENETNGIMAFSGNGNVYENKRQPGSTIKPILVFAPAIEKNIISPATKLLDSKTNFGGYSPENADKKFHGSISARWALANSYNVPAVKLLSEMGITAGQNFAKKLGIDFKESDNNLAIALGGFTEGVKLKNLCDAYTAFANGGEFARSSFISKIVKNKKTIFSNTPERLRVMKDSTAYLITDILKDAKVFGTAKRLRDFDYEIASKTGTVGLPGSKANSDAYNVSYTSEHTILSYFGGNKMPESVNGATYPTLLVKEILGSLYTSRPGKFTKPTSVKSVKLSKALYDKGILSSAGAGEEYITELFARDNLPPETNGNSNIMIINTPDRKPMIDFKTSENIKFKIFRKKEKEEIISSGDESGHITFEDKNAKSGEIYEYFVEFFDEKTNKSQKSDIFKLKVF